MPEQDSPRPTPEQLTRYANGFNQSRISKAFGARISFPTPDRARVDVEIRPEFRGGLGSLEVANGGILAAIFDLAIGITGALVDPTRRAATAQLSMSFERPVTGNTFTAESEVTTAGGKVLFSSARILNEAGQVCARCQGVVRLSSRPWANGESLPSD